MVACLGNFLICSFLRHEKFEQKINYLRFRANTFEFASSLGLINARGQGVSGHVFGAICIDREGLGSHITGTGQESLNGVNCQPSNVRKFKRHRQKNYFLFTVNRQKCRLILTVKKFQAYGLLFQVIANLTISADLQGILPPEETLKWKNQFPCSEKILFSRQ